MQPNNPTGLISGLPDNSFGGQPGGAQPQPQGQPPAPQYPPFNPAAYAAAPGQPGNPQGIGQFAPDPAGVSADPLGLNSLQPQYPQQPMPQYGTPYPPVAPQGGQYPQPPAPVTPGQPSPYQQPFVPTPMPAPQNPGGSAEAPAWAQELADMIKQNNQGQPGAQPGQPEAGWKPKDWNDVIAKAGEIAEAKVTERERNQQVAQAAEDAKVDTILRDIDNQLQYMRHYGQIPQIVNPYDANDPGKSYQRELIGLADVLSTTQLTAVNAQLAIAHRAGYRFDTTSKQLVPINGQQYTPAGQNTPIAGNAGAPMAPNGQQLPPIGQLRRASMGELMGGLSQELGSQFG